MLVSVMFKTRSIKKSHEMKLVLQNFAVIMPVEKSFIRFNNNILNSFQTYGTANNYRVLQIGSAFVSS
jgi:predicted small secreted protein